MEHLGIDEVMGEVKGRKDEVMGEVKGRRGRSVGHGHSLTKNVHRGK